jgi:hypothetical protein
MMVIRAFVILISMFLFAPVEQASAQTGAPHLAGISQPGFQLAGDEWHKRRCPRLCVEWFDGCNNCSCGKGFTDVCNERICTHYRRPRCLRWGF